MISLCLVSECMLALSSRLWDGFSLCKSEESPTVESDKFRFVLFRFFCSYHSNKATKGLATDQTIKNSFSFKKIRGSYVHIENNMYLQLITIIIFTPLLCCMHNIIFVQTYNGGCRTGIFLTLVCILFRQISTMWEHFCLIFWLHRHTHYCELTPGAVGSHLLCSPRSN